MSTTNLRRWKRPLWTSYGSIGTSPKYGRSKSAHADRFTRHRCGQYDLSWNHIPVKISTYEMSQFEMRANSTL
jgi:hypothetical protein